MTTAIAPKIGSTTLPVPKEQGYTRFYRGGTLSMADGSIVHDLVDNTARHRFKLRWEYRTDTELTTIQTAWDTLKNATAVYTSIRNTTHTVTQPENAELDITPMVVGGGQLAYHIAMELLEDS
jgi:hypothetical protein